MRTTNHAGVKPLHAILMLLAAASGGCSSSDPAPVATDAGADTAHPDVASDIGSDTNDGATCIAAGGACTPGEVDPCCAPSTCGGVGGPGGVIGSCN